MMKPLSQPFINKIKKYALNYKFAITTARKFTVLVEWLISAQYVIENLGNESSQTNDQNLVINSSFDLFHRKTFWHYQNRTNID